MQNIEAHYALTPQGPLSHYTNGPGLAGILSSRTLWATNIRFLNDAKEFIHAVEMAKLYLRNLTLPSDSTRGNLLQQRLLDCLESMHGTTWIASFSEKRDLLSQWRGYCPNGGYSIQFKEQALVRLAQHHQLVLARCIYERALQERMLKELIDATLEYFPSYALTQTDVGLTEDERVVRFTSTWFFPKMLRLGSLLKDPAFAEEQEWRLIGGLYRPHVVPGFRLRGSISVPHRIVALAPVGAPHELIDQIVIGPGLDSHQAATGLFFLLQTTEAGQIGYVQSAIPFRNQ